MKKFPPDHSLFPLPFPDGVHLRIFLKPEAVPQILLPYIRAGGDKYGFNATLGLQDPASQETDRKKLVIESSSPNVCDFQAKHLRSALLGEFISRFYEKSGWSVTRVNFPNDWGKPMALLELGWEQYGNEEVLARDPTGHLMEVYRQIHEALQPEETARKKLRDEINNKKTREEAQDLEQEVADLEGKGLLAARNTAFARLENNEETVMSFFKRYRELIVEDYIKLYARLGIKFDEYSGESQVSHDKMLEIEQALKDKEICKESEGAWIVDMRDHGAKSGAAIIRDRTGSTAYALRDLAAVVDRAEKDGFDKMIYVVANDHNQHFSQIFTILKGMGQAELAGKLEHVQFKKHTKPDNELGIGHKASTFLDQWETAMKEVLKEDADAVALLGDSDETAKALAMSALVAQELSVKNTAEHAHDIKAGTSFKSGTGPELQKSYARLCTTLRTLPRNAELSSEDYKTLGEDEDQTNLLRILAQYPDIITAAYRTHDPASILAYLVWVSKQLTGCLNEDDGEDEPAGATEEGGESAEAGGAADAVEEQSAKNPAAEGALYEAARKVLESGMTLLGIAPIAKVEQERADTPVAD
ncbi:Nucleotidylyl transferase [Polyplosphaeria fusca]|uniref:arginine--tRNA ligase n=1 Tax=Polyplosphaeria fusca TaxID=682080 RepID=A0A9P4RCH7_9PLEO|nr:Nucleotidylyl transferase [Polyplosphaeria fusca]